MNLVKNKHSPEMKIVLNQTTKNTIDEFSPMWTNKQVWEFDQTHEGLTFDILFVDKTLTSFLGILKIRFEIQT